MLKFIEDLIPPGTVQFTLQFLERHGDNVVVVRPRETGVRGDFKPNPM